MHQYGATGIQILILLRRLIPASKRSVYKWISSLFDVLVGPLFKSLGARLADPTGFILWIEHFVLFL